MPHVPSWLLPYPTKHLSTGFRSSFFVFFRSWQKEFTLVASSRGRTQIIHGPTMTSRCAESVMHQLEHDGSIILMYVCVQIFLPSIFMFCIFLAYVELCGFPLQSMEQHCSERLQLSLSPSCGPFHPDQTSPPNRCHPHLKQDFSVGQTPPKWRASN